QDELPVHEARRIVGASQLVGVSTHSLEQARAAVLDGADYIGCGPVFPSRTKAFANYVGPELLEAVAREISLPAFAIGGVTEERIVAIRQAGFRRVAVGDAVAGVDDPRAALDALRSALS
ncbi:MAG: thiamine phosphate synthase, partial [Planctomycetales bacterium]|nr:thiamine phosphate synthase [Planctomycetales bacterium]